MEGSGERRRTGKRLLGPAVLLLGILGVIFGQLLKWLYTSSWRIRYSALPWRRVSR